MQSDQERRTILAIGLSLLVYMVYVQWFMPPIPAGNEMVADVSGLQEAPAEAPVVPNTAVTTPEIADAEVVEPTEVVAPNVPTVVPIAEKQIDVGTLWANGDDKTLQATLHSREGAFHTIELHKFDAQPTVTTWWSWALDKYNGEDVEWNPYVDSDSKVSLVSDLGAFVIAGAGTFTADQRYNLEEDGDYLIARSRVHQGLQIEKSYRRTEDPHVYDVTVKFKNHSDRPIRDLWVGVVDEMDGEAGRFTNAVRPFAFVAEDIERLDDLEEVEDEELVRHRGMTDWFGTGNKYFMSILIPQDQWAEEVVFDGLPDGRYGAFQMTNDVLDAGATKEVRFLGYLGAKTLEIGETYGHNLDKSVEFGWFGFFARILLAMLQFFYGLVGNWGVAIILLTCCVKAVFFPLMQKQFVSSKRMQAIQPELKALKEKYKDNQQLQTQETMRLFKENNVNPMSGCLPMIIQMPVWFALYNVMLFSVELYGTQFLYLKDLTEVDPTGALPLLVAVLMVLQQKLMPMGNMDPAQQKMMRLMPVMFGIFMFTFPSGLVLYFSVNNTLTIVQQWFIYRKKEPADSAAAKA
ncbi:MAG: membrane protein insertase YidC [Myxococcota bacterium]